MKTLDHIIRFDRWMSTSWLDFDISHEDKDDVVRNTWAFFDVAIDDEAISRDCFLAYLQGAPHAFSQ